MVDAYAVIGNPIAQSKSPLIHAAFAAATGEAMTYAAVLAPEGGFAAAVDAFRAHGGRGLNVTAPFKLDAFAYAEASSARAQAAGAVNCLRFSGGRAEGENFDGVGLVRDIEANLNCILRGRRVLLLGAGGAARGVVGPLRSADPASLVVANRTGGKARNLAALVGAEACDFDALGSLDPFDVVINGTSSGLLGAAFELPTGLFRPRGLAYDMSYGAGAVAFLAAATRAGAGRVQDGLGMLVEQAAESFHWWRGRRPDTGAVMARLAGGR